MDNWILEKCHIGNAWTRASMSNWWIENHGDMKNNYYKQWIIMHMFVLLWDNYIIFMLKLWVAMTYGI